MPFRVQRSLTTSNIMKTKFYVHRFRTSLTNCYYQSTSLQRGIAIGCLFFIVAVISGCYTIWAWFVVYVMSACFAVFLSLNVTDSTRPYNSLLLTDALQSIHGSFTDNPSKTKDQNINQICNISTSKCLNQTLINDELERLLNLIMKDFIQSWYKTLSNNAQVLEDMNEIMYRILNAFTKMRVATLDMNQMFEDIISIFQEHLNMVQTSATLFQNQPQSKKLSRSRSYSLTKHVTSVEDSFKSKYILHSALEDEQAYCRHILHVVTDLLARELQGCKAAKVLVADVLSRNVLKSIIDKLADNDWLYEMVIVILSDETLLERSHSGAERKFSGGGLTDRDVPVQYDCDKYNVDDSNDVFLSSPVIGQATVGGGVTDPDSPDFVRFSVDSVDTGQNMASLSQSGANAATGQSLIVTDDVNREIIQSDNGDVGTSDVLTTIQESCYGGVITKQHLSADWSNAGSDTIPTIPPRYLSQSWEDLSSVVTSVANNNEGTCDYCGMDASIDKEHIVGNCRLRQAVSENDIQNMESSRTSDIPAERKNSLNQVDAEKLNHADHWCVIDSLHSDKNLDGHIPLSQQSKHHHESVRNSNMATYSTNQNGHNGFLNIQESRRGSSDRRETDKKREKIVRENRVFSLSNIGTTTQFLSLLLSNKSDSKNKTSSDAAATRKEQFSGDESQSQPTERSRLLHSTFVPSDDDSDSLHSDDYLPCGGDVQINENLCETDTTCEGGLRFFQDCSIPSTDQVKEYNSNTLYTLYIIKFGAWYLNDCGDMVLRECHVKRRFREFVNLHSRLEDKPQYKQSLKGVKGPRRWMNFPFGNLEKDNVEGRRVFLEAFLQALLMKEDTCNGAEMREFLGYEGGGNIAFVRRTTDISVPRIDKMFVKTVQDVFGKIGTALPRIPPDVLPTILPMLSKSSSIDALSDMDDVDMDFGILHQDHSGELDLVLSSYVRQLSAHQDGSFPLYATSDWQTHILSQQSRCLGDDLPNDDHLPDDEMLTLSDELPLTTAILNLSVQALQPQGDVWVCRERVVDAIKVILGKPLERFFEQQIGNLCNSEACAHYMVTLREKVWPGGQLQRVDTPAKTDSQKQATRALAKEAFIKFLPSRLVQLIGENVLGYGVDQILDSITYPLLNRHLAYRLLDLIISRLFPELGGPEIDQITWRRRRLNDSPS